MPSQDAAGIVVTARGEDECAAGARIGLSGKLVTYSACLPLAGEVQFLVEGKEVARTVVHENGEYAASVCLDTARTPETDMVVRYIQGGLMDCLGCITVRVGDSTAELDHDEIVVRPIVEWIHLPAKDLRNIKEACGVLDCYQDLLWRSRLDLLTHEDPIVRAIFLIYLGWSRSDVQEIQESQELAARVTELRDDEHWLPRYAWSVYMGCRSVESERGLAAIARDLRSGLSGLRAWAATAMQRADAPAGSKAPFMPELLALLEDEDRRVRRVVVEELADLGDVAVHAIPAMRRAAEEADDELRHAIERAIERLERGSAPVER